MDINNEYVDVQDALKRIGGNLDLYKRLLNQFSTGNHIDPIEEALNTRAFEDASHLIHTLKGVAANLSLAKLAENARNLEADVKGNLDYTNALTELKTTYSMTSQEISKMLQ